MLAFTPNTRVTQFVHTTRGLTRHLLSETRAMLILCIWELIGLWSVSIWMIHILCVYTSRCFSTNCTITLLSGLWRNLENSGWMHTSTNKTSLLFALKNEKLSRIHQSEQACRRLDDKKYCNKKKKTANQIAKKTRSTFVFGIRRVIVALWMCFKETDQRCLCRAPNKGRIWRYKNVHRWITIAEF